MTKLNGKKLTSGLTLNHRIWQVCVTLLNSVFKTECSYSSGRMHEKKLIVFHGSHNETSTIFHSWNWLLWRLLRPGWINNPSFVILHVFRFALKSSCVVSYLYSSLTHTAVCRHTHGEAMQGNLHGYGSVISACREQAIGMNERKCSSAHCCEKLSVNTLLKADKQN